jgi:hypothetical protein
MSKILDFMNFQINEAEDKPEGKSALINVFFEALNDAIDKMPEGANSYSALASEHGGDRTKADPEKDFKKLLDLLAKEGWKKDAINNLFHRYGDSIVKEYNDGDNYGSAYADIFIYKMTHKNIVAGYDYQQATKDQGAGEFFIKYGYGYHKSKYGKFVIMAQFGSLEKWFDFAASLVIPTLVTDDQEDAGKIQDNPIFKFVEDAGVDMKFIEKNLTAGYKYHDGHATLNLKPFSEKWSETSFQKFVVAVEERLDGMGFRMPATKTDTRGGSLSYDTNTHVISINFEK